MACHPAPLAQHRQLLKLAHTLLFRGHPECQRSPRFGPPTCVGGVRGAGEGSERSEPVKPALEFFSLPSETSAPDESTAPASGCGGARQLRQATTIVTDCAPAPRRTAAHSRAVAPDVSTSSTNNTPRPETRPGRRTAKAPAMFAARDATRGSACGNVARTRTRTPSAGSIARRAASPAASQQAWSKPRCRRLCACNGTETRIGRAFRGKASCWRQAFAIARNSHRPAPRSPSSLKRRTRAPPVPA